MSATTALLVVLCAWLVIGAVCSYVMARRGHDAWAWATMGALFGPLAVPLALAATRREREIASVVRTAHEGRPGTGPISALVGIDGSPDAEAAACSVVELFGPRLGRVVLANVIDYDEAPSGDRTTNVFVRDAKRMLEDAAEIFTDVDPDRVVLTGRAAATLLSYARENEIDVVVVGGRGRGLSTAVLGSVAEQVVRARSVPVLVAGVPKV